MAKVLFINSNKWGRGITTIWIASHSGLLKAHNHTVKLFDCTFYKDWSDNEVEINTRNNQYKKTNYNEKISLKTGDLKEDLQNLINSYEPDIIFWSALSSHINGEGEYVSIQYGYDLVKELVYKSILVTGGIQATASPTDMLKQYPKIDFLISGESEFSLLEIANNVNNPEGIKKIKGLSYFDKKFKKNNIQEIIKDLNTLPLYDYSLFEDQVFYRPYNGKVLRAIDYELSRGCIYTCSYCVETVIQQYYGFNQRTKNGALINAKNYLRSKSADRIYEELSFYKKKYQIELVRCQDTNFLTIDPSVLKELEKLMLKKPLNLKLYIETRPEGINEKSVNLLKNLGVDGVGMGIELEDENFREKQLNRFVKQQKIIDAFKLLKKNDIKKTTYNIIGLPGQTEDSILKTIEFNKILKPDNITVAYYSPYIGTDEQKKSNKLNYFRKNEKNIDTRIRSVGKDKEYVKKLDYYMKNFVNMVLNA